GGKIVADDREEEAEHCSTGGRRSGDWGKLPEDGDRPAAAHHSRPAAHGRPFRPHHQKKREGAARGSERERARSSARDAADGEGSGGTFEQAWILESDIKDVTSPPPARGRLRRGSP